MTGAVVSVSKSHEHTFSKTPQASIALRTGLGVEGDAHAGETVKHRSPQEILIHVLDPNREVSPNFLEYVLRLTDGRVLTGLIASETDSGLTLRRAQNQEDNILRSEIDDIASSGKSLMPEGVEQKINPQEMADLIAYLKQN